MVGKSVLFGVYGGKSQCDALPTKQAVCGSLILNLSVLLLFSLLHSGFAYSCQETACSFSKIQFFLNELNSFLALFCFDTREMRDL